MAEYPSKENNDFYSSLMRRCDLLPYSTELRNAVVVAIAERIDYQETLRESLQQDTLPQTKPQYRHILKAYAKRVKTERIENRETWHHIDWNPDALYSHAEETLYSAQLLATQSGSELSAVGSVTKVILPKDQRGPDQFLTQKSHDVDMQLLPPPDQTPDQAMANLYSTVHRHFTSVSTTQLHGMNVTRWIPGKVPLPGWNRSLILKTRTLPEKPERPLSTKIVLEYPRFKGLSDYPSETLIELGWPIYAYDKNSRRNMWYPALIYDPIQEQIAIFKGKGAALLKKIDFPWALDPRIVDPREIPSAVQCVMALRSVLAKGFSKTEKINRFRLEPMHYYLNSQSITDRYFFYGQMFPLTMRVLNKYRQDGLVEDGTWIHRNILVHPRSRKFLSFVWPAAILMLKEYDPDGSIAEKVLAKSNIGYFSLLANVTHNSSRGPHLSAKEVVQNVLSIEENLIASRILSGLHEYDN